MADSANLLGSQQTINGTTLTFKHSLSDWFTPQSHIGVEGDNDGLSRHQHELGRQPDFPVERISLESE
jgi:hypothetical protein